MAKFLVETLLNPYEGLKHLTPTLDEQKVAEALKRS